MVLMGPMANASEQDAYPYRPGWLLAQSDDAYDPFVDYSEFDDASEEEADINFFRNGRFFTLGFNVGYRLFTDQMGEVFQSGPAFGVFLSYFFDLRFALQLSFQSGDHPISFNAANQSVRGNASMTAVALSLKYYFNTQNITRGLAQLNPYMIGGFSQITRTGRVSNESAFSKEGAMGVDFGAGVEIPLMRNKMYFGLQGGYTFVTFPDESSEIRLGPSRTRTGVYPAGDILMINTVLGVNF